MHFLPLMPEGIFKKLPKFGKINFWTADINQGASLGYNKGYLLISIVEKLTDNQPI
jgi:hypothetical protein